ncbi:MAG: hypothetical protein V4633_02390 [Pseudomonadota bacterium]
MQAFFISAAWTIPMAVIKQGHATGHRTWLPHPQSQPRGESGAGQIAVARLTAPALVAELNEFKRHEEHHRAIFQVQRQR